MVLDLQPEQPQLHRQLRDQRPVLTPPPSNQQLANIAQPAYKFNGQIYITLNGNSMTVTTGSGTIGPVSFPSNGVVYVTNNTCSAAYTPFGTTYPGATGCGNVYVHGKYSGQLTIAAENDVIVDGNLTTRGDGMLGLVANNFVRIYHPCSRRRPTAPGAQQPHGGCGDPRHQPLLHRRQLQLRRPARHADGPRGDRAEVPRPGRHLRLGSNTGYIKNYIYDDRLRYVEPPNFIDPVQSAWVVGRETRDEPQLSNSR